MSRILELQPTDEQTIVARVLLELHQAIDSNFPGVNASGRQFTKTVLSHHQSEQTAVDNKPMAQQQPSAAAPQQSLVHKNTLQGQAKPQSHQSQLSGLEFSRADGEVGVTSVTAMSESSFSKWMTRVLVVSLISGVVLFAWIYLFGL